MNQFTVNGINCNAGKLTVLTMQHERIPLINDFL